MTDDDYIGMLLERPLDCQQRIWSWKTRKYHFFDNSCFCFDDLENSVSMVESVTPHAMLTYLSYSDVTASTIVV
jgi:hypothetical protein